MAEPLAPWRPRLGQWIGRVLFHTGYRPVVVHSGDVPATGPVLFVANHTGFLDGPYVFTVAPRPAHFLIKSSMFEGRLGWLLRLVGQIPVDRSVGDRRALGLAVEVLKRGGAVGMFPEGTRGRGDVAQVHQGATWLALQTGARIVPVCCLGVRAAGRSRNSLPRLRSRLYADFGPSFELTPDPALPGRERLRAATEQLRLGLAEHVAQASARAGIDLPDALPPDTSP